jgi:hypothetical protein
MSCNKTDRSNTHHGCTSDDGATIKRLSKALRLLPSIAIAAFLIHLSAISALCGVKTNLDDDRWFEIGLRTQVWYQSVHEEDSPHINDFMARRVYLYTTGQVAKNLTFFAHIAGDRLGQEGVDTAGSGLGTGISVRDAWIAYAPFDGLRIQAGRMYIPFTRAFGTESTFALLTLDLPLAQGGVRTKPFFPSNVGRDDGVTVWGNLAKGLFQYRVGVFDGQQSTQNAHKNPRAAARISINPLESENQWFNKGNYLGTKKILSFGVGYDYQADLKWATDRPTADYSAWTTDIFFDHPVGSGAVNFEGSYSGIKNSQELGDAKTWYVQGGCLMPPIAKSPRIQPYFKYETIYRNSAADTQYAGAGLNLLFRQHDVKLTVEYDKVLPESESSEHSKSIFTVQMQVGI